jgi:thiosulfate reductase cytochrome b subunit
MANSAPFKAGLYWGPSVATVALRPKTQTPRHAAFVRVTHWLTVVCFLALLVTGAEIVISHPRFYWGEAGNVNTQPLFTLHIPSSRDTVPTGFGYVMPDQNGWSRYLHFQTAWVLVLTGLVYLIGGFATGHLIKNIVPEPGKRGWRAYTGRIVQYLRFTPPDPAESHSYNVLQRTSYVLVIFVLFPLVIWTGLALSPSFDSAFPAAVNLLGGRQSARTLHFFVSAALVLFLVVHVTMIALSGFWNRMRAMITGRPAPSRVVMREERP